MVSTGSSPESHESASLIVTADDVGLHPGMTAGALRAHAEGIVTACSVVANGAAFEDAAARLRDVPTIDVGVHLALVEERPLTAIRFPRSYVAFVPRYLAHRIGLEAIESELRAQIERVLAADLRITHLNGHQHLHLLPRIFGVVVQLASEYGIPYVRIVDDRGGRGVGPARRMAIAALSALGCRARGRRGTAVRTNDHTIGVAQAGHLRDVVPLLDEVEGVTELVAHPGIGVSGYGWGYDWERETRALCDPRLREELAGRGIRLTRPLAI